MSDLTIDITFPIKDPDRYIIEGNVKSEKVADLICEFLRTQMGAGEDNSPPNILDVYKISIKIDLNTDSFSTSSNTGNKGLRDGILLDVVRRLNEVYSRARG